MFQTHHSLYLIIYLFLIANCAVVPQSAKFNHLTIDNGLSNNDVNTLIQDSNGFMWFGTEDGLNRFDGYNFKVFRNNSSDSTSISDNSIWAIMEDSKGSIWIGTVDGILNQYKPDTETFIRWDLRQSKDPISSITSLCEDQRGNIWVGTRSQGVYLFNPEENKIVNLNRKAKDPSSLSHPSVRSIMEDESGYILVGTYKGLNKLNPDSIHLGFKKFFSDNQNSTSLSDDQIYNLSKSASNPDIIWIGTPSGLTEFNSATETFRRINIPNPDKMQFGSGASTVIEETINDEPILWIDTYGGLVRMNLNSGKTIRFTHDENLPSTIIDNQINKIFRDQSGVLWLATENGISYLTSKSLRFNSPFDDDITQYFGFPENMSDLNSIYENDMGDIYLGYSNGIAILKKKENGYFKLNPVKLGKLNIWSVAEDKNRSLWLGTFGQGLIEYDLKQDKLKEWTLEFPFIKTSAVPFIKSLLVDDSNYLWTGFWGSGLGRINIETGKYDLWLPEPANPKALSHSDVWTILQDRFGRIWLGTFGGGINLFIERNGVEFARWEKESAEFTGLVSNNISVIIESDQDYSIDDPRTVLWIGTTGGLNKFVVKNVSKDIYNVEVDIVSYTIDDGLPDNSVNSIVEDKDGNLWIGTGSGICFFNVKSEKFTNFSSEDGLKGKVMNPSAALLLDNGKIMFGSKKGLNVFDPKMMKLSAYQPPVIITDFEIFNQTVPPNKNSLLTRSIIYTKEIILSYTQDVFSFEFTALDYNSPKSIKYAYKMEGFDDEWINSGERRYVTYTSLDPGQYIFKVKSTNADGVWSDRYTSLVIIVNPPWWRTSYAYLSYLFLIVLGLFLIRQFELNRTKLRNELKMRQFESEQLAKLEEFKSRFFANLSHEFRTPLMLIKGPLEQLKQDINDNLSLRRISIIERNSIRLKELIDQLLELSQLEKAVIPVKANFLDVVSNLIAFVEIFRSFADQKNIKLEFVSPKKEIRCWIDRDKLEKIVNNLLSNSLKFTPDGGWIRVTVSEQQRDGKKYSVIKVSDNGIGIPEDKIDKIFNRFFQVDDSTQRSFGGSGVGLALVKEFAELHRWEVTVKSSTEEGTEFSIHIPMWDNYLDESQKLKEDLYDSAIGSFGEDSCSYSPESDDRRNHQDHEISIDKKPIVLIVDDSEDVRSYLIDLLKDNYRVIEAADGESGIKTASEHLPDIVISDVMMPSMDGIEFCSRIKSNWQTSDIPVIMLTAKASFDSKMEGFETGADEYITKPFISRELLTRIKNLLEQRKRVRDKYNKRDFLTETIKIKADEDLISKAAAIVLKNLDNTEFNTDQLASEMLMSRTQLHRKFVSTGDKTPGEFIRLIKLNHAAKLLMEHQLSVTQIAYEVGFSSPAQFSRAFRKQFNCLPSEFKPQSKS